MSEQSLYSLHIKQNVTDLIKNQDAVIKLIGTRLDHKSAANKAGWSDVRDDSGEPCFHWVDEIKNEEDVHYTQDWVSLCQDKGITVPLETASEFYEVSDWLAGELKARGELVDTHHSMIVWARYCSQVDNNQPNGSITEDKVLAQIDYWFQATLTAQTLLNGR
jgi:hypothetical protein